MSFLDNYISLNRLFEKVVEEIPNDLSWLISNVLEGRRLLIVG